MPAHYAYPPTTTAAPTNLWAAVGQLQAVVRAAHTVLAADGPASLLAVALAELRTEMDELYRLAPELVPTLSPEWSDRIARGDQ